MAATIDVSFNLAPQNERLPYRQVSDIYFGGDPVPVWSEPEDVYRGPHSDILSVNLGRVMALNTVWYANEYVLPDGAKQPLDGLNWCHYFAAYAGTSARISAENMLDPTHPGLDRAASIVTNGAVINPRARLKSGEHAVIGNPEGDVAPHGDYPIAVHSLVALGLHKLAIQISGTGGKPVIGTIPDIVAWRVEESRVNGDRRNLGLYVHRETSLLRRLLPVRQA